MSRTLDRAVVRRGAVVGFDREIGIGVVRGADGTDYPFHCIQIADGTRDIDIGTEIGFVVIDRFGRREAAGLTPC